MSQHEHELEDLAEKLENEKSRQLLALREKMATRRQRKLEDLRRKHDVDLTKEMLEQKKELNEIRQKKAKDAERKAIAKGIKDNGVEESEKVIKAVLAQRQAQVLICFQLILVLSKFHILLGLTFYTAYLVPATPNILSLRFS